MSDGEKSSNKNFVDAQASFNKHKSDRSPRKFGSESEPKEIDGTNLKKVHEVEEILRYAIKGDDGGKKKSISPSKRLNMKAIITESSEKEYITNHGEEGKDIKINMVVDRSGSMAGRPTREANILIAAFNNLAFEFPELDVNIMFSATDHEYKMALPIDNPDSPELWKMKSTGDAEGLSETIEKHFKRIKEGHVNLVYTDGDIYDEAIDKARYKSQEVELVGMYVNENFSTDDIFRHYEKNAKYFTETIIRNNMVSLVNELANKIAMSKDGR